MADPEGNEFDVVRTLAPQEAGGRPAYVVSDGSRG